MGSNFTFSFRALKVLNIHSSTVRELHSNYIELLNVEELSMNSKGSLLLISTSSKMELVDIGADKVMWSAQGRFGSLSPNGYFIAYQDPRGQLRIESLAGTAERTIVTPYQVRGRAIWIYNSDYLIFSRRQSLSIYWTLMNARTEEICNLFPGRENEPTAFYQISEEVLSVVRKLGTNI